MKKATPSICISALLSGFALSAALIAPAQAGPVAQPSGSEKCYGIAKAGKNDCAAGAHSCAGQATSSSDKSAYVYLPVGACAKIVGASTSVGK